MQWRRIIKLALAIIAITGLPVGAVLWNEWQVDRDFYAAWRLRTTLRGLATRRVKGIPMVRMRTRNGADKFKRYRDNQRARGMKLLRLWVPDPTAPGFVEAVRRQALVLRGAPEEAEALDFIEAAADTDSWAS